MTTARVPAPPVEQPLDFRIPQEQPSFGELPRPRVIATLAGVMSALLLAALDQTIVGTAMPRIVAELNGFEHYAWVTTAYLLTSTAGVPIFGKLSDLFGRKLFLLGGVALFVVASALCGAAQGMTDLVLFRGVQGLGAGCTQAMVFTTIGDLFPPAQRGKLSGVFGSVFGLASVIGPTAGGFLTDGPGWRWVFLVNLPLGVISFAVLLFWFPNVRRQHARRPSIDFLGAIALLAGVVPLLLALSWGGRDYAWDSPAIVGLLVFGAIMSAVFIRIEARAAEPIIPLSLFRMPVVATSTISVALTAVAMFGTVLFIPLFIQGVIGTNATQSGAVLTPMMLSLVATSTIAGQVISRLGRYRWMTVGGVATASAGMLLLSGMGVNTSYLTVVRNMIIVGLGLGVTMPVFTLAVQNAVDQRMMGVATSTVQFFRSMGGALGAAVFGSVLTNSFNSALRAALPPNIINALTPRQFAQVANPQALMSPEGGASVLRGIGDPGGPGADLFIGAIRQALAASLHNVFWLSAALLVVVTVMLVLLLRDVPLRGRTDPGHVELSHRTTEASIVQALH
jgi:EmrB/QacA subfamily drug resistance transporter